MAIDPKDFTNVVHAGVEPEAISGAIMTPIFQTSTYVQAAPGEHKGWDYSRAGNPTRDALEASLAALEGADHSLAFSSGLSAVQAVAQLLNPGDRVLVCDDVYGGTGRLFRTLYAKYNIDFQFVDLTETGAVEKNLTPNTRLVWIETPTNPLLKIIDIEAAVAAARTVKALTVVDNTFASPIFQKPLKFGADIVLHSTTKYIGGHSDLIGGALMTSDKELYNKLKFIQFAAGAVPSPFESFLLLRSIKTLAIRMEKHHHNAMAVAQFLAQHPRIETVIYPGLETHPQHQLAKKQMAGFSGIISFRVKADFAATTAFLQRLKVFALAESLGGVESLVNHPEKMTHASVPEALRLKLGIGPNLVRLSVGIESADDLIADLKQALG